MKQAQPQATWAQKPTTGSKRRLVVVGGGIGGLATALAFHRKGFAVDVLERRSRLSEDGAGIQLGPNGMRILSALDVDSRLAPFVGKPERIGVFSGRTGERLTDLPLGAWIEKRHGAPYWVAHRADLQLALYEATRDAEGVAIHLDREVSDIADNPGEPVSVTTSSGEKFYGDGVIVADGLWSPIRQTIFGQLKPRFSGKSALRAVVPLEKVPKKIRADEIGVWLDPEGHIVHYPVQGGLALALVVVLADDTASREWSTRVHPGWVQHRIRAFAGDVRTLIGEVEEWRKWALHELDLPSSLTKGRIALLGDAAHPVLPFLAQGGVLALEDAMIAAQCAAVQTDMADAFRNYEEARRPRVNRVQRTSRRNGEIYHYDGAMAQARNITLRYTPPALLMSQYDWVYGWRFDGSRKKRMWTARIGNRR